VKTTGRALLLGPGETPGRRPALGTGSDHQREGTPTRREHLLPTTTAPDLRLAGLDMGTLATPSEHVLNLAPAGDCVSQTAIDAGKLRDGPCHLVILNEIDDREAVKQHAELESPVRNENSASIAPAAETHRSEDASDRSGMRLSLE
jgi:hypothetical protein